MSFTSQLCSTIPISIIDTENNDNSSNVVKYGYLYNGFATMNIDTNSIFDPIPDEIQGICPDGWHVPNIAELQQLIGYTSFLSYGISSYKATLERGYASVFNGYSVRCVRD